ncbi:myosin-9-like [Triticum aestivum]|uniref:myosin-9-like n=1 Tax=Triticum aestivum TaxID=4565 RepID=UPI001D02C72D|nr:myosin-9-like [Triticum aestivum]
MQRTSESSAAAPQRQRFMRTGDSPQSSIFGMIKKINLQQAIEAHPALLFKQQLTAYLEKTYRMIRDNLKREISPFLGHCIQAPRTARISRTHGASVANVLAQQIGHWQSIVKIITNYLGVLKSNYVPSFLICKLFGQIFSFINVQLFMSVLLRGECCSFSHGEYVKAGLAELEQWIIDATEEYAGCSWEELKHIRQAVEFLVIIEKPKKTLEEITNDLCPVLSIAQIYRISTMYRDDKFGTQTVSSEVITSMKTIMTEESENGVVVPFLFDADGSIPFSLHDLQKCAQKFEVTDVDMPPLVLEHPCFNFLHKTKDKLDGPALQS